MSDRVSIDVIPDGPYRVSKASSVRFAGERLPVDGDLYLCRCGQSSRAPYCDGTHSKVGFVGSSEARPAKPIVVWEGATVRTHFNPNTCMHVFTCQPLKALRERELAGDPEAAAEIIAVVAACPSGALSYEAKAPITPPTIPPPEVEIDILEGGEIRLQVAYDIDAEKNERQDEDRGTLCRCGLSKNKPWCDGRHKSRKDFR